MRRVPPHQQHKNKDEFPASGAAPNRPSVSRTGVKELTVEVELVEFIRDFLGFIGSRKKLWLLPAIVVLLMFGALVVLSSGSAISPFIYTLF